MLFHVTSSSPTLLIGRVLFHSRGQKETFEAHLYIVNYLITFYTSALLRSKGTQWKWDVGLAEL